MLGRQLRPLQNLPDWQLLPLLNLLNKKTSSPFAEPAGQATSAITASDELGLGLIQSSDSDTSVAENDSDVEGQVTSAFTESAGLVTSTSAESAKRATSPFAEPAAQSTSAILVSAEIGLGVIQSDK